MLNTARAKLTTYFVLFLIVSGALLLVALDRFVQAEFEDIERDEARIAITRALQTIRADGKSLRAWARDIGPWDDTYEFIETGDPEYILDNFSPESLENLELDLMFFVDTSGSVVWSHLAEQSSIDSSWYQELPGIADHSPEWDSSTGAIGLHRLDADTVYILAVHPILNTEYGGPNRGALILGRRLDNRRFEQLIESSVANFDLQPYRHASDGEGSAGDGPSQPNGIEVARRNGVTNARTALHDFNGEPVLTLNVRAHKEVTANGARATRTVMYVFAAIAVLGFVFLQLLFFRMSRNNDEV